MQLAALKMPRKTFPGKADKNFQTNYLKIFILGQKLSENFYPRTKFSKNFYPRMKIFRKLSEIFCPMWGRTKFYLGRKIFQKIIVLGQNFSENFCPT